MINEELLRENGNLKDLVVQTSAGLEREKSSQEKLIHHNKLINSDNATLQSRVEELLSVIDRQRRELAAAYESSQRMAFEQSVAWREVCQLLMAHTVCHCILSSHLTRLPDCRPHQPLNQPKSHFTVHPMHHSIDLQI
jgi:hypothetical protein